MATNKQFDAKLLNRKLERLQYFLTLENPQNKRDIERHGVDYSEWLQEVMELVEKITDNETAERWMEACVSPLSDADESNEQELWGRFRKSVEFAQDWLAVFLSEHSIESSSTKAVLPADSHVTQSGRRVFIGHGGSPTWRVLKDFLWDELHLEWEEFNRDVVAGISTTERISHMLESAGFAFIVMTAEDTHADGTTHARENVVHEAGLFQGRLGFRKAIILFEEGCEEFSNIRGLTQIRFPKGDILARSEDVRRVLKREGIL